MIEHMCDQTSETQLCECLRVAETAAFSYVVHGHAADITEVSWASDDTHQCEGRFVFVQDLGRIDFVADAQDDLGPSVAPLSAQVDAGWEVWAVVPLSRLADAHVAYRDKIDFVQGWWQSASGEIAFTEPQIP